MENLEMSITRKHFKLFANLVRQQKALAEKHDSKNLPRYFNTKFVLCF